MLGRLVLSVTRRFSDKFCDPTRFVMGSWYCAATLFLRIPKLCTDLDWTLPYILMLITYTKFVWKNKMLALGVCLPQTCSSAGRRFATSKSRLHYYQRIVSFPQRLSSKFDELPCKLDPTENPRSFEKYPTLPIKVERAPGGTGDATAKMVRCRPKAGCVQATG